MSDQGHMSYGPEGTFVFDLICDYARAIVKSLGVPVYNIRGTNMFSLESRPIQEHASLFGQRMYKVEVDGKSYVMRYAACFQQFAVTRDWKISHRHLPFGDFEIADSYRLEQSGELVLGFRLRRLNMPDLHIFCKDEDEAKSMLGKVHGRIYDEIEGIGRAYYSLYNLTSRKFFEGNMDFFMGLVRREGKPVLLCFYPENTNYYWVLNIAYHIIDRDGRPREIGTVQMDTGNAKRFGISYTDEDGKAKHPIILHTAIIGSIERWLYTMFDTGLAHDPPMLPVWLSPVQVRLAPVSEKFVDQASSLGDQLNASGVRADVDDRPLTVPKKVREAESSWIPYVVVIGEKEANSKEFSVRVRGENKVVQMSIESLVERLRGETKKYPERALEIPMLVSKRPIYSV